MPQNIPDSLKLLLYDEAEYQCAYCGHRDGLRLTIHHIRPKEENGPTDYGNLIVLCHDCHHRVHHTGSSGAKDIRRIKRYLVHRFFTPAGVSAAKLAYEDDHKVVPAAPYVVQHLVDHGFFEQVEVLSSITLNDEATSGGRFEIDEACYRLTEEGVALVKQWLLRSDDSP